MPLCTHPDLPGQVADLIHPEAHPGWEPVKPKIPRKSRKQDDPGRGRPRHRGVIHGHAQQVHPLLPA